MVINPVSSVIWCSFWRVCVWQIWSQTAVFRAALTAKRASWMPFKSSWAIPSPIAQPVTNRGDKTESFNKLCSLCLHGQTVCAPLQQPQELFKLSPWSLQIVWIKSLMMTNLTPNRLTFYLIDIKMFCITKGCHSDTMPLRCWKKRIELT